MLYRTQRSSQSEEDGSPICSVGVKRRPSRHAGVEVLTVRIAVGHPGSMGMTSLVVFLLPTETNGDT